MIRPKPLVEGARVALICPSSWVPEGRLEPALASVRSMGLEPVVYESCTSRYAYYGGADSLRAADVNAAFADPDIDGVLCIRGGYGAQRLMSQIQFDKIAQTPKVFCGYSDITALHIMLNQKCGFETYHTPMPSTEWYKGLDRYTLSYLRAALFGKLSGMLENPEGLPLTRLSGGKAKGRLTGGNLSLVASSLGTPYEIDTRGKILFLEDIDEKPYRVDSMLLHLKNAGKFRDCAGILLGAWTNCVEADSEKNMPLRPIFEELLAKEGKPVLSDLVCGHCLPTMSLPMGAMVEIDADAGSIRVTE